MKKTLLTALIITLVIHTQAQKAASVSTDLTILRNFSGDAGFTTFGQTVRGQWHLTDKDGAYAWINYYINAKYKNDFTATPYSPVSGGPVNYTSTSKIGYRQISLGWQHYLKGHFDNQKDYSLYTLTGFGLLTGKVENTYNQPIDTATYFVPAQAVQGTGTFRRLTLDLGLGIETQLGTGIFLYGEVRTWLPLTDYPSPYLYNNDLPRVAIASGGVRILFDY